VSKIQRSNKTPSPEQYQRDAVAALEHAEQRVSKVARKKEMTPPWEGGDGFRRSDDSNPLYPDRIRFLRLLEKQVPDLLAALANGEPIPLVLRRHRLSDTPWITRIAELTLAAWASDPKLNRKRFSFRNLRNPRSDDPITEPRALAPLTAEDWEAWRNGCPDWSFQSASVAVFTPGFREAVIDGKPQVYGTDREWFDAVADEARRQVTEVANRTHAARASVPTINDAHLEWLIQYQVLNLSFLTIAARVSRTRPTVTDGIKMAANSIGITCRRALPPGRPRKK
jgi:hypothetical protein